MRIFQHSTYQTLVRSSLYALTVLILCCCSSKLILQSEPPNADVYVSLEGKKEKIKIGVTPLELLETQLYETLKLSPDSSDWLEFSIVAKNYQTKDFLLPSNRWGELSRTLKIHLSPAADASTTVTKIIRLFFNAKKFTESRQFEEAHKEIDKVIEIDSEIPQAYAMKAGIYFLQNRPNESMDYYKRVLALDPSYNEAIQMLDRIKSKEGTPR